MVDSYAAAKVAEACIKFHHGTMCAAALSSHHMDLGRSHGWKMAMDYDIQQHELAALNPSHDLSSLDMAVLTLIATHPCPALLPQAAPPSPKCPIPPDTTATPSKNGHAPLVFIAEGQATSQVIAAQTPQLPAGGQHQLLPMQRADTCCLPPTADNFVSIGPDSQAVPSTVAATTSWL